jgi:hypothetical protein
VAEVEGEEPVNTIVTILAAPSPSPTPGPTPAEQFVMTPMYWCIVVAGLIAVWALRRLHIGEHGDGPGRG